MSSNAREVAMRASASIAASKRLPWAEKPALKRHRPEPVEAAQRQVAQAEINTWLMPTVADQYRGQLGELVSPMTERLSSMPSGRLSTVAPEQQSTNRSASGE
jgi:hypothetical protein